MGRTWKAFEPAGREDRFLLLVGYSPNDMPLRGADGFCDLASPDVVEKACWRFADNGFGTGLLHKQGGEDAFRIVENYIYRNPVPWEIENPKGQNLVIKQGTWLIGGILSPQTWADYKKGRYGSGSLQGGAERIEATAESLARVRSVA